MAARLSSGQLGLELLENTLATVAGLAVIVAVLAPVSGPHLNPVVSAADWALGRQSRAGCPAGKPSLTWRRRQRARSAVPCWPT